MLSPNNNIVVVVVPGQSLQPREPSLSHVPTTILRIRKWALINPCSALPHVFPHSSHVNDHASRHSPLTPFCPLNSNLYVISWTHNINKLKLKIITLSLLLLTNFSFQVVFLGRLQTLFYYLVIIIKKRKKYKKMKKKEKG